MNEKEELLEKLIKLEWLLQKQRFRGREMAGPLGDTTRGQGRILAILKMKDGVSTKDLAYLLGIRISSLNELLSKLERGGYLTREPSETDKRVMLLHLTEKGREEEPPESAASRVFDCFTEAERTAFGAYLDRIITALETELAESGEPEDYEETRRRREEARERFFGGPEGFGPRGPRPPHEFGPGPHHGPRGPHGPHDPRELDFETPREPFPREPEED